MDLSFSPRGRSLPAGGEGFHRRSQTQIAEKSGRAGTGPAFQRRLHGLAQAFIPQRLGGAGLAQAIWRRGMERDPALHFLHRDGPKPDMPTTLPFGLGMVGPVIIPSATRRRKRNSCPAFSPARLVVPGLFRARRRFGSRVAHAAARCARAIIMSSMARRPGPPWRNMPIGFSAWCAPIPARKPQEGISFLLIDMKSPGITVKPIIILDGAREVNEVFFDNVKVPAENLVGEENKGWTYAKFLLEHERFGLASASRSRAALTRLKEIAQRGTVGWRPLIRDPDFARKLAALEADLMALEFTELRILSQEAKGEKVGRKARSSKSAGSEIQQRVADLAMEAVGYYALPDDREPGRQ